MINIGTLVINLKPELKELLRKTYGENEKHEDFAIELLYLLNENLANVQMDALSEGTEKALDNIQKAIKNLTP